MLHAVWAVLLLALLSSCPGTAPRHAQTQGSLSPTSTPTPAPTGSSASSAAALGNGQLRYDGQRLVWQDGTSPQSVACTVPPVPYQLTTDGPVKLVTALLPGLEPATCFAGTVVTPYRGYLPVRVDPPLIALEDLPSPLTGVHASLLLLRAEGTVLWRPPDGWHAELATSPLDSAPQPAQAYVFCWQGGTPLTPYGQTPELRRISLTGSAAAVETLALNTTGPAADLVLLASSGSRVLVLAQLGADNYEFILGELAGTPAVIAHWPLGGQPITPLTYPGPAASYSGLVQDGAAVSLVVHDNSAQSALETWRFDLATGQLSNAPFTGKVAPTADADNAHDHGAAGPPHPQTLLPTAGDPPWTIPALADGQGHVLVVHGDGSAEWAAPGAVADTTDTGPQLTCLDKSCVTGPDS